MMIALKMNVVASVGKMWIILFIPSRFYSEIFHNSNGANLSNAINKRQKRERENNKFKK
jgi:hypothetical protein